MLRSVAEKLPTFFKKRGSGVISIKVDALTKPGEFSSSDSVLRAFHDAKDACMHAVISKVALLSEGPQHKLHAVFALPDTSEIKISLITKEVISPEAYDKDFIIAKCAAESILRNLFAKGLIESEVIAFTATRGTTQTNGYKVYTAKLFMKPSAVDSDKAKNDTIASVYAHLHAQELHIEFNVLSPILREATESILSSLAAVERKPEGQLAPEYRK